MDRCHFIPPYLLARLADSTPEARSSLRTDVALRARRAAVTGAPPRASSSGPFSVYTADHGTDLPGRLLRAAGAPATGDDAADEAYAGVEASLALFKDVFDRDSFDDKGAPVLATVHYSQDYDNAFWDGTQLVFGDGDQKIFGRFTRPVDVLGHELSHALTQYTANLSYDGQPGALNESMSDAFGLCVKQRGLGQSVDQADWLIGEGIFLPGVKGVALRSMKAPGTAYDDPQLGKDPQVGSMDDYVDTQDDNGGVHTNSGIPNKAFYLAATAIGGNAWDGAAKIWYAALTSGIGPGTDFAAFAAATLTAAQAVSAEAADAVAQAWKGVKVTPATGSGTGSGTAGSPSASAGGADAGSSGRVAVVRSGGLAGLRRSAELSLGEDPRTPQVESLLSRVDVSVLPPHAPQPDRFVYSFHLRGEDVVVGERDLTPELDQLSRLLLDE